jgi:hypothetical protein
VTVPTPQVANPTIVGGTRTIRRADIEPGAGFDDSTSSPPGPAAEVDMTGGASVLRKEETVIGAPPVIAQSAGTRAPTRQAAVAAPRAGAGTRQAPGRPYPPQGGPKKKNNTPMIMGIVGGAVALIMVVVLVVVMSGGGGGSGGTGGTGTGDGSAADTGGSAGKGPASADEQLLAQMRTRYNSVQALNVAQIVAYYNEAKQRNTDMNFKSMQDSWATELARRAGGAKEDELADIALMLDDDKYPQGKALLDEAWRALKNTNKATRQVTEALPSGGERRVLRPNPKFVDIVTRLGWQDYQYPQEMDEYVRYDVEGASEYSVFFNRDVEQVYRDVKLFPPDLVTQLNELHKVAKDAYDDLAERNKNDGFAFQARAAWLRFKQAQNSAAKSDRKKGRRSFSPTAMGRETEDFDDIWTYTYWRPFIVYVEKPIGSEALDTSFIDSLASKAALLKHLYDWFDEKLIRAFNLQRVKPQHNAKLAEEEGWPIEVVVLKDSATFEKYVLDYLEQPMPGARAFYAPLEERVMTWDDRNHADPNAQWFNESVLIHETFHQLSDHYAANPMFASEDMQLRPRYANILVQEGLTDSVSGFTRQGEGKDSKYEFLQLNHLRLSDYKAIYERLGKKELFRIRDTLDCRHYGQCRAKAFERAQAEKMRVNPMWLDAVATGVFYAVACQISYFFHHYKGGTPYQKKWWEYVAADYKGEINVDSWSSNAGIDKFKEIFNIKNDADWDKLEKEFLDFTLALTPENVGKGGADFGEKDENVTPGIGRHDNRAPGLYGGNGPRAALPGRKLEKSRAR